MTEACLQAEAESADVMVASMDQLEGSGASLEVWLEVWLEAWQEL